MPRDAQALVAVSRDEQCADSSALVNACPEPGSIVQPRVVSRPGSSAIDAAAKVLAEDDGALNCQEMIDAMAKKGYWTSPGGKTPAATLYSAILRESKRRGTIRASRRPSAASLDSLSIAEYRVAAGVLPPGEVQ